MSDHEFCRNIVTTLMDDVRKHTTVEERKAAWTWKSSSFKDTVEFHGPNDFYWYGSGCCLYSARADGWDAYLRSIKAPGYVA